jgi:hypothetical protein
VGAGPGLTDPFHVPLPAAAQLNADGKTLYRQGRWEEARQKYRAAEAADPDFLAPALNVACSFVRQERFAEATDEVLRLIDRGYLPWSQEVLSAADLGALKVRGEGRRLKMALDAARLHWAQGLSADLILVARLRPPLKLPQGIMDGEPVAPQALVLGPRQEVFAWSPRTRRYRQITSEEGRVLAVARSRDRRRIAYVTAEKLISGSPGGVALRGVAVNELELETLAQLGRAPVTGDVRRLEIGEIGADFAYRIDTLGNAPPEIFTLDDHELRARPGVRSTPAMPALVALTAAGVPAAAQPAPLGPGCAGSARDVRPADGKSPFVLVTSAVPSEGLAATEQISLGGPHGAGLLGLPVH